MDRMRSHIVGHLDNIVTTLRGIDVESITSLIQACEDSIERGASIYTLGNGGSAATAAHFALGMTSAAQPHTRTSIRAIPLTEPSFLTAQANDLGYEHMWSSWLKAWATSGDMCIVFTVHGNSTPIVTAMREAQSFGLHTAALCGSYDADVLDFIHFPVIAGAAEPEATEDVHLAIVHAMYSYFRQARV